MNTDKFAPIRSFFRKIERMFLIVRYKGIGGIFERVKARKERRKKIEK